MTLDTLDHYRRLIRQRDANGDPLVVVKVQDLSLIHI